MIRSRVKVRMPGGLLLIYICLIIVLCAAALAAGTAALAQHATVGVEEVELEEGGTGTADVWVRGITDAFGLGAYEIRLEYDPGAVEVTGVLPGDEPFDAPVYNVEGSGVNITGYHGAVPGPTGDVRIAALELKALAAGNVTFDVAFESLISSYGDEMSATGGEGGGEWTDGAGGDGDGGEGSADDGGEDGEDGEDVEDGGTNIWVIIGPVIGVILVGGAAFVAMKSA